MKQGEMAVITLYRRGVKGGSAPLSANKIPLYGVKLEILRH